MSQSCPQSEHVVSAVAERLVIGALAAAKVEGARRFGDEAVRLKARDLVRAVAERLLGRASAGAPEIGPARFERHLVGTLLGTDRLVRHQSSLAPPSDRGSNSRSDACHTTLSFIFSTV